MNEVLAFWLCHRDRWWKSGEDFDEEIRRRFASLHIEILNGEHEDWRKTAAGSLAYVVVLDQFSRNMFRGDARAYRSDDRALAASREALARGDDGALSRDERTFLYMPFMHSEVVTDQERGVALFRTNGAKAFAPPNGTAKSFVASDASPTETRSLAGRRRPRSSPS